MKSLLKMGLVLALLFGAHSSMSQQRQRRPRPRSAAECVGRSPHWIALSWIGLQTCHDAAQDGDTISLLPGSHTAGLGQILQISKYVIVDGTGATVTDNTCSGLCGNRGQDAIQITSSPAGSTQFLNFTIVLGTAAHLNPSGVITLFPGAGGQPVRVGYNKYNTSGATRADFIVAETNVGLIDHNEVLGFPSQYTGTCSNTNSFLRHKPGGSVGSWQTPVPWGNKDTNGSSQLYVEDNKLDTVLEGVDIDDNARQVYRFNQQMSSGYIAHGVDTSGIIGVRSFEAYNNVYSFDATLISACGSSRGSNGFIGVRGGAAIIVQNTIPAINTLGFGAKNPIQLFVQQLRRAQGGFPCWGVVSNPGLRYPAGRQVGWGWIDGMRPPLAPSTRGPGAPFDIQGSTATQDPEPVIVAANTGGGNYDTIAIPEFDDGDPASCVNVYPTLGPFQSSGDYVQANRDYYQQVPAGVQTASGVPFNGTGGTGFGTRALRPSTCTTGVAYWTTDQGSWNMSTSGDMRQGVLDKCTATDTWTNAWYVPYRYPHPLNVPHPIASVMAFSSEPVYGVLNQTLNVPIEVASTGGATDTFSITPQGAGCTFSGTAPAQAVNNIVSWNLTPTAVASGCSLIVQNTTNPAMAAVTSATFNVTLNPPPTIQFVTQPPATTISGSPFSPAIAVGPVGASVTSGHVFTMQVVQGVCGISPSNPTATANGSGVATFTGLTATSTGVSCAVQIQDTTNTDIPAITSSVFAVTAAPTGAMTIVNNGNAVGCAGSSDAWGVTLSQQSNAAVFDTTGADLIIVVANRSVNNSDYIPDFLGSTPTANQWTKLTDASPVGNGIFMSVYYTHPVDTGPNWNISAGAGSTTYPSLCAIALHGSAPGPPLLERMNSTGGQTYTQLPAPLDIYQNAFVLTSVFSSQPFVSGPSGFSTPVRLNVGGGNSPIGMAWKFGELQQENPVWSFGNQGAMLMSAVVFTPAEIVQPPCEDTDLGNGWTCVAASGNHLGANGGTSTAIDTTNAGANNLLVIGMAAHELDNPMCGGQPPTDSKGNVYTPLGKTVSQGSAVNVQMFYKTNGVVGANHTITCTGVDTYPVSIFAAYKPANPTQQIVEAGNSAANPVTSIAPGSVTPNQPDALVITTLGTSVLAGVNHTIGSSFQIIDDVPGAPIGAFGGNIGGSMAVLTMAAPAAVNPTWAWTAQTEIPATRIAVFNNLNNVISPYLSFQSQPSSTPTGSTMASFIVAVTGNVSGTVTLTPTNCLGATFTGLTATISGGTATFNTVVPTGFVSGCTFSASAPGANSAVSAAFDITLPLGLSFTQQPTDTLSGQPFNPPIAGRKTTAATASSRRQ